MLDVLLVVQVIGMAGLVIIAGFVEGYGYGLSLGTRWPYHEKILVLAMKADPEAWHRIVATILGLVGVALVILAPGPNTITGLVLIVITAVLGMATLHVLAGRWPAFLQGLHGLLAYSTYITYLLALKPDAPPVWDYLKVMAPLHPFLVMIFLGGVTTGSRGYQRAIGGFKVPRSKGQWAFSLHYVFGLVFLFTLGYYAHSYSAAFALALAQFVFGFLLFHAVNDNPKRPGILVVFHQGMALLILLSLVYGWKLHLFGL